LSLKRDESLHQEESVVCGYADDAVTTSAKLLGHVLVVDDSEINRIIAQHMLEDFGLTVAIAENGQEALDQLQKQTFDLILMDCEMPIMDGYEASRKIRSMQSRDERTPIVALTADAFDENRKKCKEAGMDGFLSKPIMQNVLLDVAQQWIKSQ
jgi:CheY-like chemotaxis protein